MKNKILCIFVLMLMLLMTLPITGIADEYENKITYSVTFDSIEKQWDDIIKNGETLDQSQTDQSGHAWYLCPDQWMAQAFIPTIATLTRVELLLYRHNDPPVDTVITVSIRDSLTGTDLTSTSIVAGIFTPNPTWVDFNFSNIKITKGQTYYIVAKSNCNLMTDGYAWADKFNNPYTQGDAWISSDKGSSWYKADFQESPECDMCFKTYGIKNKIKDIDDNRWTELIGNILKYKEISFSYLLKFLEHFPLLKSITSKII